MFHINDYITFIRTNRRFLSFGFVILLTSSFGQTYVIGVFGPAIRTEFGLSHTDWSTVYMIGTLSSALLLPWTGQLIDRISLPRYTAIVIIALSCAAAFISFVPSVALLVVAIFLLRQTGQGLMSHTGSTAMARYLSEDRGKAVAVASLGFTVGESVLPVIMVLAIGIVGWRTTYGMSSLVIVLGVLPLSLWLLKGHHTRHKDFDQKQSNDELAGTPSHAWSRRDVLRDYRYYLLLPAAVAPSFVGTGLFFHHLTLAELKGWDPLWFAGSYWVYAVGSIVAMLTTGPLIDRLSAVRILPTFLLPMAGGLVLVWAFDNAWWAWPYLFLFGVTSGITYSGLTALWAEVYGVKHLGAIKSLFTAISVFSSALGPISMGVMMDAGVSIETISLALAAYCVVTTCLLVVGLRRYHAT